MFIQLTDQQEKRIVQDSKAQADIRAYAEKIADTLPEYVEPLFARGGGFCGEVNSWRISKSKNQDVANGTLR